jgi:hypothetical protein
MSERTPGPAALARAQAITARINLEPYAYVPSTLVVKLTESIARALESWGAERDALLAAKDEELGWIERTFAAWSADLAGHCAGEAEANLPQLCEALTVGSRKAATALRLTPTSVAERAGRERAVVEAAREFDKGYSFQQHNPSAALRLRKALAALDHTEGTR